MLNSYQKMVIQRALGQAADKDAEIKNLAVNMKVSEEEVRAVVERQEAVKNVCKDSQEPKKPATEQTGKPGKRVDWTPDMWLPGTEEAFTSVKNYLMHRGENFRTGHGLILMGAVGCGKTHLGCAIVHWKTGTGPRIGMSRRCLSY